eukprot:7620333-Alexandrium_andersonii.AAC.1
MLHLRGFATFALEERSGTWACTQEPPTIGHPGPALRSLPQGSRAQRLRAESGGTTVVPPKGLKARDAQTCGRLTPRPGASGSDCAPNPEARRWFPDGSLSSGRPNVWASHAQTRSFWIER